MRRRVLEILLMCALLVATVRAADGPERFLFSERNGFRVAELQATGARLETSRGRLRIEAAAQKAGGERRGVVFPLRDVERDLSAFRHVELEIANVGATPA